MTRSAEGAVRPPASRSDRHASQPVAWARASRSSVGPGLPCRQLGRQGAGELGAQDRPVVGQQAVERRVVAGPGEGHAVDGGHLLEVHPPLAAQGGDAEVGRTPGRDGEQQVAVAVGLEGDGGDQQLLDPAEVVVDDPDRHAGPGGDVRDRRVRTPLVDEGHQCLEDDAAGCGPPWRGGRRDRCRRAGRRPAPGVGPGSLGVPSPRRRRGTPRGCPWAPPALMDPTLWRAHATPLGPSVTSELHRRATTGDAERPLPTAVRGGRRP